MKHTVELKDDLYDLFKKDPIILKLLQVKDKENKEELNKKIIRNLEIDNVINDDLPVFFNFTFIPSVGGTRNYKVNEGILEFNLFARNQSTLDKLYLQIKKLVQEKYEDMQVVSEGSFSTSTENLLGYMVRFRPLCWS